MCTTGAITLVDKNGEQQIFGFKTSDSPWTEFWHGQIHENHGYDSLAYGLVPQQGINAGMNEKGLTVISSFFDYTDDTVATDCWQGDLRGIVQADILRKCQTADEAKEAFLEAFQQVIAPIGGNHIIIDAKGNIYVFEHCRGRTAIQETIIRQYVARSNQGILLFTEEQQLQNTVIQQDRQKRLKHAEQVLKKLKEHQHQLSREDILNVLKDMLSHHVGDGSELGSICAHGITKGRSNSEEPHETMSGLIWDVKKKEMYYTVGHPCSSEWRKISFQENFNSKSKRRESNDSHV